MSFSVVGLDHVQIAAPAGCEAEARAFFGGVLGLVEVPKPEPFFSRGGCWFAVGRAQLHVGVEEPFRPSHKAHPAFVIAEIALLFEVLERAEVPCQWDAEFDGRRRFSARDPWGNKLKFIAPPHERSLALPS